MSIYMCVFAVYMYVYGYGYVHVCAWCMCIHVYENIFSKRQQSIANRTPTSHSAAASRHSSSAHTNTHTNHPHSWVELSQWSPIIMGHHKPQQQRQYLYLYQQTLLHPPLQTVFTFLHTWVCISLCIYRIYPWGSRWYHPDHKPSMHNLNNTPYIHT